MKEEGQTGWRSHAILAKRMSQVIDAWIAWIMDFTASRASS